MSSDKVFKIYADMVQEMYKETEDKKDFYRKEAHIKMVCNKDEIVSPEIKQVRIRCPYPKCGKRIFLPATPPYSILEPNKRGIMFECQCGGEIDLTKVYFDYFKEDNK